MSRPPHIPCEDESHRGMHPRVRVSLHFIAIVALAVASGFVASVLYAAFGPVPTAAPELRTSSSPTGLFDERELRTAQESVLTVVTDRSAATNRIYTPQDIAGYATALTSDGWLITTLTNFKDKKVVTRPQHVVPIDKAITDPATGLTFIKINAQNLRVLDISSVAQVGLGDPIALVLPMRIASAHMQERAVCITDVCPWQYADKLSFAPGIMVGAQPEQFAGALVTDHAGSMLGAFAVVGGHAVIIPFSVEQPMFGSVFERGTIVRSAFTVRALNIVRAPISDPHDVLPEQGLLVHLLPVHASARYTMASAPDVQEGDVITEVEGQPIESDTTLFDVLNNYTAGATAHVTIVRAGTQKDAHIQLGAERAP